MPEIPVSSALGYLGVFLLIAGVFLIAAGFGIIRVEKIIVTRGMKTTLFGIILAVLGAASLLPEITASLPNATPTFTPDSIQLTEDGCISRTQIDKWNIGQTNREKVIDTIDVQIDSISGKVSYKKGEIVPSGVLITSDLGLDWSSYPVIRLMHDGGGWGVFETTGSFVAPDNGQYWCIEPSQGVVTSTPLIINENSLSVQLPGDLSCQRLLNGYCDLDMTVSWSNLDPNGGYYIYTIGHGLYYQPEEWWIAGNGVPVTTSSGVQIVNDGAYGSQGESLGVFACLTRERYVFDDIGGIEFYERPHCELYSTEVTFQPK
jgi:hypothetical protein